jgi:DNA modification methylase
MKKQQTEKTGENQSPQITGEILTGNPADKIEHWPIEKLIPYARNSRTHSDEQIGQIAASIKEWGWTTPILVDEQGGIIAGHGRTMAAQRLKIKTVPVMVATGWSEAKKRAYIIADNRLALNAGWDNAMLATEFKDLMDLGFDVGLTGFTEEEIDALMPLELEEGLTDPDDAPEAPANPVTVQGDVWVMGSHRLLCGDSTSIDDLENLCAGQPVDMWLTDPPYNVAYEGGTKEKLTIKNDSMGDTQFREFLRDAYTAANAVMKAGAVFYIWHADSEGYNFRGAAKDAGWTVRQCLIWKKSSLVLGRQDYQWQHEPCLYGWKEGASHLWASDRKQTTILEFDKPARNGEHPTMKPVALFEYQLLNNTKGGDIVLDSFGGSGTTLIAAEKNGRVARLMELDPKYCDVIVTRWQAFTGKHAHLESDGRSFTEVMGERSPNSLIGSEAGKADAKQAKKPAKKAD